jgi:hypothetical protein
LVLKSPPHTARIRLLLEVFPGAKFVHVHRDPYTVFSSTRKMLTVNFSMHCLQRPPTGGELDEWIIRQYRSMHDAFFEERDLIPPGQYHEVRFDELEADPIGQMERVYDALGLEFCQVRPALERYVEGIRGYRKNAFPELPAALRRRIADAWRPCFEQWGYALNPASDHDRTAAERDVGGGPPAAG